MIVKKDAPFEVAMIELVCAHGGMDYYDFSLCKGLMNAGVGVRLYTSEAGPLLPQGLKVIESFKGIFGKGNALIRGLKWFMALRASLSDARKSGSKLTHIHFFDTGVMEYLTVRLARSYGLKVVATVHDVESFHKKRSRGFSSRVLGSVDGIIVHNEVSRAETLKLLSGKGVRLAVIKQGHFLEYIGKKREKAALRAELGLALDAPLFLFFGQIKKVKGLDVAIRAMGELKKSVPQARLLVAGRPWKDDAAYYEALINEVGVAANVIWHKGYVPQDRVDLYYYACDAVVQPYRRIYQSAVLLMAMSYGCPVIVSDLPGMTEVVKDGENGYVFPDGDHAAMADAMKGVIDNPERTGEIAACGLEYVKRHYDWDSIGRKTAEFYKTIA
ncbi:MAG: glycosyltransferase family 4 protein [Deltaproteobacteria bacterium]|nr:glycosyltransferase family 4 protein [Deltaproteobacteria bacterium]